MSNRCPTVRGKFRCTKDLKPDGKPHDGDCHARDGELRSLVTSEPAQPECPTCGQTVQP